MARSGLLAAVMVLAVVGATATPLLAAPSPSDPTNFVVANGSGSDFQVESATTGALVKDLGSIPNYTNNGLTISPDGRDLYATVTGPPSLMIERVALSNGHESFVADGGEPSLSPNGHFLAYGTGPAGSQSLAVRDLGRGTTRTIDLAQVLGRQNDLITASIIWLGNGSRIVVLPGGVGNDLMGETTLPPTSGSCSAVSTSATCLIVVDVKGGRPVRARRVVLKGLAAAYSVLGRAGSSGLVLAVFHSPGATLYSATVSGQGALKRLFSIPSGLPVAFDPHGTTLLYLVGHGPVALWRASVTPHGLANANVLNANTSPAGLAW